MSDVVRQSLDLSVGERLCGRRHTAVEIGAGLGFEAVKLFEEVGVMLPRQARNLVLPDQSGRVARGTVMPFHGSFAGINLLRIGFAARRWNGILCRIVSGKILHLSIAQVRGKRGHLRVLTPPLPELDQLIKGIEWRLCGQRGDGRVRRVAIHAMALSAYVGLPSPRLNIRGSTLHGNARGSQSADHRDEPKDPLHIIPPSDLPPGGRDVAILRH
jgi:hypothetical protein